MADMNEAPYSANFRMYFGQEPFQFTVRREDEKEFISALTAMVARLEAEGWQFIGTLAQNGSLPPANNTVAAVHAAAHNNANPPAGVPGTDPGWKMDNISGYVVGGYHDSRDNIDKPVVWLYAGNAKYKSYVVYPERKELLPFTYPTSIEWQGGAPEKSAAIARNLFHPLAFQLPVVPERNPDGTLKQNKSGYQVYRIPRQDEMKPAGTAGSTPVEASFRKAEGDMHPETSLRWEMTDDLEAVEILQIESPLDTWLVDVRNKMFSTIPLKDKDDKPVKSAIDAQFDLINEWAAGVLGEMGVSAGTLIDVEDVGKVPLAGIVFGILIDRYADKAAKIPEAAAAMFLQRVMKRRGASDNPLYSRDFDENFRAILETVAGNMLSGNNSLF